MVQGCPRLWSQSLVVASGPWSSILTRKFGCRSVLTAPDLHQRSGTQRTANRKYCPIFYNVLEHMSPLACPPPLVCPFPQPPSLLAQPHVTLSDALLHKKFKFPTCVGQSQHSSFFPSCISGRCLFVRVRYATSLIYSAQIRPQGFFFAMCGHFFFLTVDTQFSISHTR